MQKKEHAFVECQFRELIQRAAEKLAKRKQWAKWVVDKRDIKEFLEEQIRIEAASERKEGVVCLVHEIMVTNKQTKLAKENKLNERNEDLDGFEMLPSIAKSSESETRVEAKIEFTGNEHSPGRKAAKLTYEARVVDNQSFKMLVAKIDKDYEFRVYQLNSSFLGQNPIKTGAIGGAVAGAVVGGAIGVVMAVTLTAAGGAGGAAIGKLMSMPKSEEVMTAHDIFCFSKEDKDMGEWWEEGRYVLCRFKYMYMYPHSAEAMTLEEFD